VVGVVGVVGVVVVVLGVVVVVLGVVVVVLGVVVVVVVGVVLVCDAASAPARCDAAAEGISAAVMGSDVARTKASASGAALRARFQRRRMSRLIACQVDR
jgi:hypothetical protein